MGKKVRTERIGKLILEEFGSFKNYDTVFKAIEI